MSESKHYSLASPTSLLLNDEEIIEKEIAASKAPCGKPINTTNANAHQSINIKPI